jgi:hypothetical protein
MKVKVIFLLHKIFELEKDNYLVNNVNENSTITEFIRKLSNELRSEIIWKLITESNSKGLLVLVNGTIINDLNTTFKTLKNSFKGSEEFEITIVPLLEGGSGGR